MLEGKGSPPWGLAWIGGREGRSMGTEVRTVCNEDEVGGGGFWEERLGLGQDPSPRVGAGQGGVLVESICMSIGQCVRALAHLCRFLGLEAQLLRVCECV